MCVLIGKKFTELAQIRLKFFFLVCAVIGEDCEVSKRSRPSSGTVIRFLLEKAPFLMGCPEKFLCGFRQIFKNMRPVFCRGIYFVCVMFIYSMFLCLYE